MSLGTYYANKSNMIQNKYNKVTNKVLSDYNSKKIKSKTEYLYYLNVATKEFINSLDMPLFKFHKAISTPTSEHFNVMVNSAIDDVSILLNESVTLYDSVNSINNEMTSYLNMFNHSSNKIIKTVEALNEVISSLTDEEWYIFSDSFNDTEKSIEQNTTDSCKIDIANGYISLSTNIERNYSNNLFIEILEDSNGYPGNTHEVNVLNGNLHFIGENESYVNMYNLIDNNNATWFEYEIYKVADEDFFNSSGFGFNYKEGVSWITNDNELRLSMKFYFEEVKLCNWVSLSPFIQITKGSKHCVIDTVIVSDGLYNTQKINLNKEFDDTSIVTFEPQDVKYIKVNFKQKYPYKTNIGHFYSLLLDRDVNVFDIILKEDYKRVDYYKPSIELLGMTYDPATKKCINPNYDNKKTSYINQNLINNELFTIPTTTDVNIHSNIEMLNAYRYAISIKNIDVSNYVFNERSVYCSKPYETENNITYIELEASDYIPESFKTFDTSVPFDSSNYIKYELSFDGGNLWYELYPKHRVHHGPCAIDINSDVLPSMRNPKNIRYIDRVLDTNNIMVRITLKRPEGYIYDSPIVYNYKLSVKTGGNEIENI